MPPPPPTYPAIPKGIDPELLKKVAEAPKREEFLDRGWDLSCRYCGITGATHSHWLDEPEHP